jgi:hypothetical protein
MKLLVKTLWKEWYGLANHLQKEKIPNNATPHRDVNNPSTEISDEELIKKVYERCMYYQVKHKATSETANSYLNKYNLEVDKLGPLLTKNCCLKALGRKMPENWVDSKDRRKRLTESDEDTLQLARPTRRNAPNIFTRAQEEKRNENWEDNQDNVFENDEQYEVVHEEIYTTPTPKSRQSSKEVPVADPCSLDFNVNADDSEEVIIAERAPKKNGDEKAPKNPILLGLSEQEQHLLLGPLLPGGDNEGKKDLTKIQIDLFLKTYRLYALKNQQKDECLVILPSLWDDLSMDEIIKRMKQHIKGRGIDYTEITSLHVPFEINGHWIYIWINPNVKIAFCFDSLVTESGTRNIKRNKVKVVVEAFEELLDTPLMKNFIRVEWIRSPPNPQKEDTGIMTLINLMIGCSVDVKSGLHLCNGIKYGNTHKKAIHAAFLARKEIFQMILNNEITNLSFIKEKLGDVANDIASSAVKKTEKTKRNKKGSKLIANTEFYTRVTINTKDLADNSGC